MNNTSKQKILLVEDDTFLSSMYGQKFQLEGFDVQLAEDGEKALEKITAWQPDLILLDMMIPKISGAEILKKIKADEALKKIPVIVLTNLDQRAQIQECVNLGAADYLIKAHYMPSQVVDKVKETLSGKI